MDGKKQNNIETVCYEVGNPIVCNGSSAVKGKRDDGSRQQAKRFICGPVERVNQKSKSMQITKTNQYQTTSLMNNRQNNRARGNYISLG